MNRRTFLASIACLPFASATHFPKFRKEEWKAVMTIAHFEYGFTYRIEPDGRVMIDDVNRGRLQRTLAMPNLWEEVRRMPGLERSLNSGQNVLQKI